MLYHINNYECPTGRLFVKVNFYVKTKIVAISSSRTQSHLLELNKAPHTVSSKNRKKCQSAIPLLHQALKFYSTRYISIFHC